MGIYECQKHPKEGLVLAANVWNCFVKGATKWEQANLKNGKNKTNFTLSKKGRLFVGMFSAFKFDFEYLNSFLFHN